MSGSGARPKYSVVPGSGGVPTPFDQHFDTPEAMEEDLSSGGPTGATQLTNKWNTIVETSGTFPPAVFNIITLSHAQEDLLIEDANRPNNRRQHRSILNSPSARHLSSWIRDRTGVSIRGKLASLVYYSRTFLGTDRSGGGAMHETGKPDPRD
ncbi:hypothetical protein BDZ97DRAFT_1756503 [Flammula alnicola]|nr:hypothetical protein BDZ97DRAFT_2081871 [Flammula alnicola]KAF8960456.1 hypothetical protein BDZ97DRAFT_2060673 [Flammula alnicola]KAF8966648.1 hypothetical protein BDZ97DRAFT_1756503 [Flammula alnicola]